MTIMGEATLTKRSLRTIASTDVGLLMLFGAAVVLLHILVNGRYGFHRDELQTFSNARYLAWGYVEYPHTYSLSVSLHAICCLEEELKLDRLFASAL